MGFGGNSATRPLRGLVGVAPDPRLCPGSKNIVCCVDVAIFHVPATAAHKAPRIERHLLAVLAEVTRLGR